MELQIQKQTLSVNEIVFDSQTEQPVEADILLPDYCPDIQRILHCDLCCLIRSAHGEQQRITVEGELRLNILYVSDSGMIRGIDHKQPFTRHLDSKTALYDPMCEVHCKVDYVNCRAVSSRRLELRGAVTLRVRAINCARAELVSDCSGLGVQLKKSTVTLDGCLSAVENNFSVHEELELGNHQPVAQILSAKMKAILTDHKCISDKIVTKGELKLQLLYLPLSADEKEAPQELEYSIPISQIVNAGGAGEDSRCCVSLEISGWDIQPKPDLDGEMKVLSVDAQVRAFASVHQEQEITLVQDCYSTVCPMTFEEKQLSFLNFVSCLQESHRMKETLSAANNVQCILASWARVKDLQSRQSEEGILISGSLSLMALVLDCDGVPQVCEEVVNLEHTIPLSSQQRGLLFRMQLLPTSVEAVLNNGQPELRCQLQLSGCLYSVERQSGISSIRADESCRLSGREDCALCIYYADADESVWNIAKKYNSSVTAIMEENSLDHDILPQRTMLLIPMC